MKHMMTLLNRMTIKTRMILAFALMTILIALFGANSLQQMGVLGKLTATLYNHPLRVSNAALKAKSGVISMHRFMKDVSTSKTRLSINTAIQKVETEETKVYRELEVIRQHILGREGKQLVEETIVMFDKWKPIRLEVEELVLEGDQEGANRITREKGAQYVAKLERKMTDLTFYARHKADGFMQDAQKIEKRVNYNSLLFIAALIAVAVVVGYFISASIMASLTSLIQAMERITESGELETVPAEDDHEISRVAGQFNKLVKRLGDQFWLEEGQNILNWELNENLLTEELLQVSIEKICSWSNGCAGAVYLADREAGVCVRKASFALSRGNHTADRFAFGQGPVGQVAEQGQSIFLENITIRDSAVVTGTICESPVSIVVLPLVYGDQIYGVLEMASFESITEIKKEYLYSAANIVSVVLHTAFQNDRIKNLLAASQESNEKLQLQTEELEAQAEELRALNEEFVQQSDELKQQNVALDIKRLQVEEANRLKSEFLSNMSHELRTPLNSVNALSRVLMLQTADKLTKEESGYLEIIERNGKRLLSLINDILDLSKIEAGKMDVTVNRFSVTGMVEDIIESLRVIAQNKQIYLEQKSGDAAVFAESDENRVHQILQNVISNAVKFTDTGGVAVQIDKSENHIQVVVKDTGIGMSPSDLETIFEEFRQVDGASTRRFEGTGLGLSIACKAAELLGGGIKAESKKGAGSTFYITLPATPSSGGRNVKSLTTFPTAGKDPEKRAKHPNPVLVVDDDPDACAMISDALADEGYRAVIATSGKEALKLAGKHRPMAITLDVIMPEMDGWELLGLLKKDPLTKHIPVIIVSVSTDKTTGEALGAVGYVDKPIAKEVLLAEIKKIGSRQSKNQKRVLLVEDNTTAVLQVTKVLDIIGVAVDVAADGEMALDLIEHRIPDVIILDIMMPGIDGFEVLETIRSKPLLKKTPVLILTAKDLTSEDIGKLSSNNVHQLIQKGDVDPEGLLDQVKAMLTIAESVSLNPVKKPETIKKAARPIPRPKEPGHKPVILVAEDTPDNMTTLKAVIGDSYKMIEAVDGEQGIETAVRTIPDLILLDMSLPKKDGLSVVRELRKNDVTKHIPVIALTAQAMKGDREKILAGGCDDYVAKPIDPQEVRRIIDHWMGQLR